MNLSVPSKMMEKILDEASVEFEIPSGSFKQLKKEIINVKSVTKLMGSHQYYKTIKSNLEAQECYAVQACKWGLDQVDPYHEKSKGNLKKHGVEQFGYNAFDIVRDLSFRAWFPVQKNVAEWMGDTKVARLHRNLISGHDLKEMERKMRPGDILVVRHNWYLSNIGLPGFWPHAELYIGNMSQLEKEFDDPKVTQYLQKEYKLDSIVEVLQRKDPNAWKFYKRRKEGRENVIIEAVSEGVVFSTLEEGAGADYVGVIRPKLGKVERAIAIINTFSLHGLPYDFNFDFATDDALVCTELVFKAYQSTEDYKGLFFPTVHVMGRNTLPANDLIRHFATKGSTHFDFVYFLDGREETKSALVSTEAQFQESWKRPKWDIVQK